LYEELERALAQLDDEALTRVAVASRRSGRVLSVWARRLAERRDLSRTPGVGIDLPDGTNRTDAARGRRSLLRPPRQFSWLWEAVAFAIGCAVAFQLI
jgi:hypothetical protein